ncbi:MAG: pyridoxamine 5'-phosphate oxidase [Cyanobacteria bacterium P01_F01_bin.143]
MNQFVADLRQNYTLGDLTETNVDSNPIQQFKIWFEQAIAADIIEPNAMTLATATPDGKPTARIVLLKGFDERGFVFYTNYQSLKGQQAIANPYGALVFFWDRLQRQVRIEGKITKVSPEESDSYFHSRPLGSQIGAVTSNQSEVIPNREFLQTKQQEIAAKYQEAETIPRPDHWGGFLVIPDAIEFWQGRPNRLHDRLRYRLQANNSWIIERLAP